MRLTKRVTEGASLPKGYGVAWREPGSGAAICYPIGLNLIARFIRDVYWRVRYPESIWRETHADLRVQIAALRLDLLIAESRYEGLQHSANENALSLEASEIKNLDLIRGIESASAYNEGLRTDLRLCRLRYERMLKATQLTEIQRDALRDATLVHERVIEGLNAAYESAQETIAAISAKHDEMQRERTRVAAGNVTCADCNAILARF